MTKKLDIICLDSVEVLPLKREEIKTILGF